MPEKGGRNPKTTNITIFFGKNCMLALPPAATSGQIESSTSQVLGCLWSAPVLVAPDRWISSIGKRLTN